MVTQTNNFLIDFILKAVRNTKSARMGGKYFCNEASQKRNICTPPIGIYASLPLFTRMSQLCCSNKNRQLSNIP